MDHSPPDKSARKSAHGRPFAKGGDPRQGRGPTKGAPNAGRPPTWLRESCDELLYSPKCQAQVKAILEDRNHPAFATMWKAVADRAHGKPTERIESEATENQREPQYFKFGGQLIR